MYPKFPHSHCLQVQMRSHVRAMIQISKVLAPTCLGGSKPCIRCHLPATPSTLALAGLSTFCFGLPQSCQLPTACALPVLTWRPPGLSLALMKLQNSQDAKMTVHYHPFSAQNLTGFRAGGFLSLSCPELYL